MQCLEDIGIPPLFLVKKTSSDRKRLTCISSSDTFHPIDFTCAPSVLLPPYTHGIF